MNKKLTQSSVGLGDYIRVIRLEKGYSQSQMANILEISQNAYCLLENGQTKFHLDRIIQISRVFELSPQEFLDGYFNESNR